MCETNHNKNLSNKSYHSFKEQDLIIDNKIKEQQDDKKENFFQKLLKTNSASNFKKESSFPDSKINDNRILSSSCSLNSDNTIEKKNINLISDGGSKIIASSSKLSDKKEIDIKSENNNNNNNRNCDDDDDNNNNERDVDCGYAWIILAVMFIINASTYGTARAYGLIFEKIARQDEQGRTLAALPFTIMGSIEYMGGPLTGYLITKTSWRLTVFVGSCLITLAHLIASIDDSIINRTLTMGLMCGLGCSFVTISSFQINNAYFKRYRSRAFGLGLTGAAVGTFYISPLCQYVLDNYTTNVCYLLLGIILFPNVLLSLLLKPKKTIILLQNNSNSTITISQTLPSNLSSNFNLDKSSSSSSKGIEINISSSSDNNNNGKIIKKEEEQQQQQQQQQQRYLKRIEKQVEANKISLWKSIKLVLLTPLFHLIWPTQLLFCWFNFVYGMIIVDFGKDRGLCNEHGSRLILFWASGQLAGRLILGYLVDLKFCSNKTFTIVCFIFISISTHILNNIRLDNYEYLLLSTMIFTLSMFISTLYLLFNNLIVEYMDKPLTALSIGISSFTGSFFLLPRANIIGYYRDSVGNYDSMLTLFTYISFGAAIVWLIIPPLIDKIKLIYLNSLEKRLINIKTNLIEIKTEADEIIANCSGDKSIKNNYISSDNNSCYNDDDDECHHSWSKCFNNISFDNNSEKSNNLKNDNNR